MGGAQRPSVWSSSVTLQCRARAPHTPHAAGPAVTAVGSDGGGHQRVGVASGWSRPQGWGEGTPVIRSSQAAREALPLPSHPLPQRLY